MKHTKKFWADKYSQYKQTLKELKQGAKLNKARFKPIGKQNFRQLWEAVAPSKKGQMKTIIDAQLNMTGYHEAQKYRRLFKAQGIDVSVGEIRALGTRELADKYNLSAVYNNLIAGGKSGDEAKKYISYYYFGSE